MTATTYFRDRSRQFGLSRASERRNAPSSPMRQPIRLRFSMDVSHTKRFKPRLNSYLRKALQAVILGSEGVGDEQDALVLEMIVVEPAW